MWFGSDTEELDERQLAIMSLGLPGEVGEVVEILKKRLRDGTFDREHLKKELGDAAFYLFRLCRAFGLQPSEVLAANIDKLEGRRERGTMRGSGDDR
jgi:NTP pyrophosphatase (non-canonical NTP hydrolase)